MCINSILKYVSTRWRARAISKIQKNLFSVSAIYIFNKQKTNNIVSSFDYLLFKSSES